MPDKLTLPQVLGRLKPGMTVYVSGMSGESTALYQALQANPSAAAGIRFVGALFPGINRSDYLGLAPDARQRAYFMLPGLRKGLLDRRAELMPLDYPGIYRDLARLPQIDIAFVQLSPPDEHGSCSLGVSCDFQAAVWARAKQRIAHINLRMPRTRSTFPVRYADLDAVFEAEQDIVSYDAGAPGEAMRTHASLVASLVYDGDTLEFGVGKLQSGILSALSEHQRLRVWSGMASAPILPLLDRGIIAGKASVNIGVALGTPDFYERTGRDEAFCFRPVNETHDVASIAAIDSFCAINSAVEIDLFGQINAESANGRLIAGVGGLPAFIAGALRARSGRSIIALPASTEDGRSRIVPQIAGPGLAALPRQSADYVVTEFGIAALRDLDLAQRAAALIRIAAPEHREALAALWHDSIRVL